MNLENTKFAGLLVIHPTVFGDERGFFLESWNQKKFNELVGESVHFVQDNHSMSHKNILRGLHIQVGNEQGKLVRVARGSVLDVVVDLRESSKTFGQYYSIILSEYNKKQMWIPKGFAHGFLTLEDNTNFLYKCDNLYDPSSEVSLSWNDDSLSINWDDYLKGNEPILSKKDSEGISLKQFEERFL